MRTAIVMLFLVIATFVSAELPAHRYVKIEVNSPGAFFTSVSVKNTSARTIRAVAVAVDASSGRGKLVKPVVLGPGQGQVVFTFATGIGIQAWTEDEEYVGK